MTDLGIPTGIVTPVHQRWNWVEVTAGGDAGFYWLRAEPKRWYALYPSFWLMVIRTRSLMPSADVVIEETEP